MGWMGGGPVRRIAYPAHLNPLWEFRIDFNSSCPLKISPLLFIGVIINITYSFRTKIMLMLIDHFYYRFFTLFCFE